MHRIHLAWCVFTANFARTDIVRPIWSPTLTICLGIIPFACVPKLSAGLVIPPELVLIHERGDHWSMQTAVPCKPSVLNSRLTSLLAPCQGISKDSYFTRYPFQGMTAAPRA